MSKNRKKFVCIECGHDTMQWSGKCPTCHEWNTLEEDCSPVRNISHGQNISKKVKNLSELEEEIVVRDITGIGEFDRVMGGGVSPGSITLIGGQPGVGKSTLLLEVINKIAENKSKEKAALCGFGSYK